MYIPETWYYLLSLSGGPNFFGYPITPSFPDQRNSAITYTYDILTSFQTVSLFTYKCNQFTNICKLGDQDSLPFKYSFPNCGSKVTSHQDMINIFISQWTITTQCGCDWHTSSLKRTGNGNSPQICSPYKACNFNRDFMNPWYNSFISRQLSMINYLSKYIHMILAIIG